MELVVQGIDLTGCDVYVTLWQQGGEITTQVGPEDMARDDEGTTITVGYTQEQTASLDEGRAKVQVNWVDGEGRRNATAIAAIQVSGNLLGRKVGNG
jgi:hypothetical protein